MNRSVNGPDSPQTATWLATARSSSSAQPTDSTPSNPAAAIWAGERAERTSGTTTGQSKPRATSSSRIPATHLSWESKAAISRAVVGARPVSGVRGARHRCRLGGGG